MNVTVTHSMFPDALASTALITLAIYHIMVFLGRKKDAEESYNLYFSMFAFSAALFIIAPYFQPQYFLNAYKPNVLNVINLEMFSVWFLFFSGIKFLNLLLKVPSKHKKTFHYLIAFITLNFIATFSSNLIGQHFYFKYVLSPLLLIIVVNVIVLFSVYGYWIFKERLYKDKFVSLIFFGFVLLISNVLIYRTIELLTIPKLLVVNHYITAIILYIFAYALSVKFNKEHQELKDLKTTLDGTVDDKRSKLVLTKHISNIDVPSVNEKFIQKALNVVEKNIDDTGFDIGVFCNELNMSRTQVHRKLAAITGQSTSEFIRSIRLKRAAQLLCKNAGSVSEIAYQSGFNNLSYFTKTFKAQFGVAPSKYTA